MTENPYSKYYPTPLKSDEYSYVWTADGAMAFQWEDDFSLLPSCKDWITEHLNGESVRVPGFKGRFTLWHEGANHEPDPEQKASARYCTIYYHDHTNGCWQPVMMVRGWGHLTGCGAHSLPHDEAAKIQDGFLDWAVARLNEKDFPEAGLEDVDLTFDRGLAEAEYHAISETRRLMYREHTPRPDDSTIDPDCMYESSPEDSGTNDRTWFTDTLWEVPKKARHRTSNQPWYARYQGRRRKRR